MLAARLRQQQTRRIPVIAQLGRSAGVFFMLMRW
jgi:hypothetical protein